MDRIRKNHFYMADIVHDILNKYLGTVVVTGSNDVASNQKYIA